MSKNKVVFLSLLSVLSFSSCATTNLDKKLVKDNHNCFANKSKKYTFNHSVVKSDDLSQISRYVTVQNGPTSAQINPLLAVSTFKFPPSIYTVGEAVNQVVATTGYKLSNNLSKQARETLKQPLPITDRKLGPMKIQTVLQVLLGAEVYNLQRDPLHRLVNFEVKPSIAKALGVNRNE